MAVEGSGSQQGQTIASILLGAALGEAKLQFFAAQIQVFRWPPTGRFPWDGSRWGTSLWVDLSAMVFEGSRPWKNDFGLVLVG